MKIIADFHIHSKYSRACSQDLTPENLALWATKTGIGILGAGDCTHPKWLYELSSKLTETEHAGLYRLRDSDHPTLFLFTAEVSSIYKQGDKVRRVHNLLLGPSIEAVKKLN